MIKFLKRLDKILISEMHQWGIPALRAALGIVFLWFGTLKILGLSPVAGLVQNAYSFFPEPSFMYILGIWEVVIGLGLIFKIALRFTLGLLWLQMAGTLASLIFAPSMFFIRGNLLLLTLEGEFLAKNLVLISSGLVIGGYEIKKQN